MEYQPKGGITMETKEKELEILDEGMENCEEVAKCCTTAASART
jgi:putative radical SAM-modified peptide